MTTLILIYMVINLIIFALITYEDNFFIDDIKEQFSKDNGPLPIFYYYFTFYLVLSFVSLPFLIQKLINK